MHYYIFKLKFTSPARFGGDTFSYALTGSTMAPHSDTLFSAISNEWIKLYGEEDYEQFINYAVQDEFLISDMLPYKNDQKGNSYLYVPKPVIFLEKENTGKMEERSNLKKELKKLEYIKIDELDLYIKFLKDGGEMPVKREVFGHYHLSTRVHIDREGETTPYNVMSFVFHENAGLYFIIRISNEFINRFKEVITSLGETGIGGKKTSGFGKFHLYEDEYEIGVEGEEKIGIYSSDLVLADKLYKSKGPFMSISMQYPVLEDFDLITDKDTYMLLHRRGFVYSDLYAEQFVKRKPSYAFNSGSVFSQRLKGQILDLSVKGSHPVYRYGKGFFIGGIHYE